MKHTPGPWKVHNETWWPKARREIRSEKEDDIAIIKATDAFEANALLIAAAPELRAAVEKVRDFLLSSATNEIRRAEVVQMLDDVLHKCDRASD